MDPREGPGASYGGYRGGGGGGFQPFDMEGPPGDMNSENDKKKNIAIGVSVFVVLLLGVGGFLIYWFVFRDKGAVSTFDDPGATSTIRADQTQYYSCVLGECKPQIANNSDTDIQHNLDNGIWFTEPTCKPKGWKEGDDPPPCQGKFKCTGPPPSMQGTGASIKANKLKGNLCKQVSNANIKAECGAGGINCTDTAECEGKCIATYWYCPNVSAGTAFECQRATPAIINSATTDIMLEDNCPILCTRCFKTEKVGGCLHGAGGCLPTTGACDCPAEWSGESCETLRYGTCAASNGACNAIRGVHTGITNNPNCVAGLIDECGPDSYAAFTCEKVDGDIGYISKSCTCISKENVTPGGAVGAMNTPTTSNPPTVTVAANNFGCNGALNAVCRLDGFKGGDQGNACVRSGETVTCAQNQCSSDDDCKNVCLGHDADGSCTPYGPLVQADGSTLSGKMCTCPSGGAWDLCGIPSEN